MRIDGGLTEIPARFHVGTRMAGVDPIRHTGRMSNALFYLLTISGIVVVAGLVVLFFAMRNVPEGFESQDEGFVGLTKGDEMLLNEFAAQRTALLNAGMHAAA